MSGYLIHEDDVPLLHGTMRAFRGGSRNPPPTKKGKQPPPNRPPIVAVLLEDLRTGETAEAAVLYAEETNETQMVTIKGTITGGSFKLRFRPKENVPEQTTEDISFNAKPEEVQAALEALPSINPGDVEVSLGESTGRWFVTFTGQYAGRDMPLMQVTNTLASPLGGAIVTATTYWEDTGRTERIRSLLPAGTPTPLVAGAMVVALWFPRIGYGVISAECRDLDVVFVPPY
jgi:hypothetical protein